MKNILVVGLALVWACSGWAVDAAAPAGAPGAAIAVPTPVMAAKGIAGWIGSGGDDKILIAPGNLIPLSSENFEGDRGSKSAFVLFDNSEPGVVKDSLELKFTHTNAQSAKGEWSWASASLATPMWQQFNASNKKTIQFYIKGLPQEGNLTIGLSDLGEKKSGSLEIAQYIDAGTENDWRRVAIPIKDIPGVKDIDLTQTKSLSFGVVNEGSFDLFIDNVVFDKVEAKKPLSKKPALKPVKKPAKKSAKKAATPVVP